MYLDRRPILKFDRVDGSRRESLKVFSRPIFKDANNPSPLTWTTLIGGDKHDFYDVVVREFSHINDRLEDADYHPAWSHQFDAHEAPVRVDPAVVCAHPGPNGHPWAYHPVRGLVDNLRLANL